MHIKSVSAEKLRLQIKDIRSKAIKASKLNKICMMFITSDQLYKDLSYFLIIGADIVLFGFCLLVFELVGQHERNTELIQHTY